MFLLFHKTKTVYGIVFLQVLEAAVTGFVSSAYDARSWGEPDIDNSGAVFVVSASLPPIIDSSSTFGLHFTGISNCCVLQRDSACNFSLYGESSHSSKGITNSGSRLE
jgi:hypothetical protein